jgi:hypothetical protein
MVESVEYDAAGIGTDMRKDTTRSILICMLVFPCISLGEATTI